MIDANGGSRRSGGTSANEINGIAANRTEFRERCFRAVRDEFGEDVPCQ